MQTAHDLKVCMPRNCLVLEVAQSDQANEGHVVIYLGGAIKLKTCARCSQGLGLSLGKKSRQQTI